MNSKTTIAFSTMAIAAVALLFASGPTVGNQQAQAYVYVHHFGFHHFGFHHFGFHHFGFHHFGFHHHYYGHYRR
ncbi:MAG: hypothetical protein WBE68_07600 [Candidatus Nitrosopolaris sp.]